jgi:acetyl esterase/lipase
LLIAIDGAAQPTPLPALDGAAPVVYKQTGLDELRLWVFNPTDSGARGNRPAIVLFFGGTWTGGSVEQFAAQARYFRGRGMVAIVADYRVRDRHKTTPFESMADARSAIRWVRAHASELNVDAGRIAAGGGAAGAHAALSAALFDTFDDPAEDQNVSARPDALVLFNPVVDTARFDAFGSRWRDASPAHHLTRPLPPTVIFQGKQDVSAPYAAVEQFCHEAVSLGSVCELHEYEGAGEGFFDRRIQGGRWYLDTLLSADRFLTSLGYLAAPVSADAPN